MGFQAAMASAIFAVVLLANFGLAQYSQRAFQFNSTSAKSALTDISLKCPEGWELEGSKCFKVYHLEKSWPQALSFCGRYGSLLARIESQKENLFVTKLLNRPQRSASSTLKTEYWIGIISHRDNDEDDAMFMWSDGTMVSRYTGFWAKGQPDYRTGTCVKASTINSNGSPLSNIAWHLEMCNMLFPFVCELPACVKGSFFCHNGGCVPESTHCNGNDDCGDLSDELNCPASHSDLACLKYEKGESGKIQSPNYPSSYRTNSNCRWVIEGPVNSRIQLTFDSFETEENQDIVTIVDGGPSENASLAIDTISGTPKLDRLTYTSSTNMMVIRFRSDALIQARGFQASWRAVSFSCGGRLKAQLYAQSFSSPEYPHEYPNGLECVWRIDAPQGQLISLNIDNYDMENERDFVVIYDGAKSSAPILAKLTGRQINDSANLSQLLISSQSHLYIYFSSNYAISGKGFSISYKRGCDNVIRQSHGQLLSPGHTRVPYPSSQTCKYTIELPENREDQPISVAINHFDVASDDNLQFFEGGEYGRALHEEEGFNENTRPPKMIFSKQSKLQIVFQSNSVRNSLGWNVTFSTNCPPLDIPSSVAVSTHNTAFNTKVFVSCSSKGHEFINGRGRMFEVQCLLGGRWTENRIPTCQPVYCSPVPQIANGFAVSATNVSYGAVAKYSCYDGFSFSSGRKAEEITCNEDGKWSAVPQCKAAACPALISFTNGERKLLFGDGTSFGTVYSFECAAGHRRKGAATILCQNNGEWSTPQPRCEKLVCTKIPEIQHGKLLTRESGRLEFDGTAKVECNPGFKSDGVDSVKCLANQTLSSVPQCIDIDECKEQTASCAVKSTNCNNLPGGYFCECKQGFKPQLACQGSVSLITTNVVSSSEGPSFPASKHSSSGWCALKDDNRRTLTFTFAVPKIIERLRIEKTAGAAYPTRLRFNFAMEDGVKLKTSSQLTNMTTRNVGIAGSELLVLDPPLEAKIFQIVIEEFKEAPCIRVDLLGCQKTSCADINECDENNGYCEHHCINMQGTYRCSCDDGYDLFMQDEQNGIKIKEGETGKDIHDTVRFNKSCVPSQCQPLTIPENGQLLSTANMFHFPTVVEFRCNFGFQMMGPSHLKCQVDGNWNGTSPFCIPAACHGAQNNTAIGLFVTPEGQIPYGNNVTIVCSQQNRPARISPLSGFRQCIYDPQSEGPEYWLSGPSIFCPLVDCGPPPVLAGVYYEGDDNSFKVGSTLAFSCRPPYSLIGKSSYDDRIIRCNVDGSWDLGNLRCEGPVCVDPGYPDDGTTQLDSVEEGAIARFSCNRPGYQPFPSSAINCTLGTACVLSEDVGISSGFIPDGAFADNSDTTSWGYEPHKARLSSTGWCGSKDAFIFLSVDLQRIYTLTTLRMAGVAGSGHLKGHVTKMQLFYKVQFSQNYDTYPLEFETPSGNHNKMYQFELNPPLRARYVLLGITEYETNPCLRFDMQGCLAPLSAAHEIPTHLQVGWNSSVPQCIDAEPPVFQNCPQNPIFILSDEFGQLQLANYTVPTATDNSGSIAFMRIQPSNFVPPRPITVDTDVIYSAYDDAGNSAECIVKLRIPDTQPPVMKCPESYVIPAMEDESEKVVYFNESSVELAVQDSSNITDIVFTPSKATLKLGGYSTIEASAMDHFGNKNKCSFQVALLADPCSKWSLSNDNSTVKECTKMGAETSCIIKCAKGFRFVDEHKVVTKFKCNDGRWSPSNNPPACVPIAQEPARYELNVAIRYNVATPVDDGCLKAYTDIAANFFDTLDTVLSQRCSSSVQVYVRFLDVKFTMEGNEIIGNYTVQVLPTVLKDVFYELCGLTMRTIFDLRIPGATTPIRNLLMLSGDSPSSQGVGCPAINATSTTLSQGFGCADGEILREGADKDNLPECFPCSKGTVYVNNTCVECPVGSYQDENGKLTCKSCPAQTFTHFAGAQSVEACLSVCGNGMFSASGLVPCQTCPRHTFAGPPVFGGYKQCEACPEGTYTSRLGSTGPSQCKQPCQAGSFSTTGLEPCSPCPLNYYQSGLGQQRCIECHNNTFTKESGSSEESHCEELTCSKSLCQNRGICSVHNHKEICECRPGYTGQFCEEQMPLCDTQPCYNDGICEATSGTFRCICPQNFTGARCQFGPDECIGVNCPNGGVCQDLPGLGTSRCLCRTGFTGPDCSQIADPCLMNAPCKNGADCVPLQLGRYKCKCLPGWEGTNCDRNIDDCAESPCALGATCHDLVNDFECECPHGFSGKRCHIKDNLCEPNPCINGKCVDTLFDRLCICKAGWSGQFCDVNMNDCESQPCKNGASCRDMENGYECQCTPGFHGSECQHMVDHCATEPCQNNGTCINQGAKYECQCRLGFEGVHCENNINECEVSDNGCDAHGTELCEDLVNGFRCQCRPGYTGKACDVHIDQCAGEPCHNNGTCVDLGASSRCECASGWTGDFCEKQAGKCGQNPCQNDGHCVSLAHDDYFCVCPEGVSGKNCEVAPNRCIGEPCHNGGVCGDFGSHLECTCAKGFVGAGCQYELDACHASKCENGAKCVQEGTGYKCTCPPGFTGQNCETNIDDCSPSPCPLSAACIDQINDFHCQCPFNMTGSNCDKKVDPDYDIHFFDSILPAQAALAVPFKFNSGALTVSFWVKFDTELSKGTVFTLYNSATPNYPYNVTELLQVTAESVKLSLFDDETALNLHFPNKQRLNDGNWNNLVLTWTSHEGAYSLIWNAVRLYADSGYGKNKQLDINAWISLGHPLDASDDAPKFVGSLTRVNMWTRVLDFENDIPQLVQKCHGQQVVFNGLALRFAGYDRLSGKVEKIVKSTCGRDKTPEMKSAKKRDENSVTALSCPGDVYVITPLKEVNVTWEEPVFVSNNAIEKIEQNLKPGQVFTWGEFTVLYVAYDNSSNIAQCTFKVHVSQEFCPDLADPMHGIQSCENWGPDLKFRACSIQCEEGYEFSSSPAVFYTCAADGVWKPRADNSYTFRYPSCSSASPADRIAQMKINYPAVSICNAASKNTLAEKLLLKVHQLNSKWNICSSKSDALCQRVNITVDCTGDMKRLRRQNNGAQQTFNVHVEIPIKREMVTDPKTSQKVDIIDVIQDEALLRDLFNLEQVLPNGRPDLNSFQVKDRFDCEPGRVVVNDMCVLCAPGSFYDKEKTECTLCGIGEYQNKAGQFACSKCPEATITTGPGALDEKECQTHCKAGNFLNLHTRKCEACGFGFYQPASGSFACIPCGVGKTTLSNTAASEDDCRDECPDGEHLTQSGTCHPCPMGSYRTKGSHKQCVECPPGTTTETVRSSKRVQCNTPKCVAGQFLVTSTKQCQYCPRGTYQDEPLQTTCKLCATDHTTSAQGATHESQCYSTNQCATGEDNCSWNAVCIDLPDDNDIPSFQCKCKPGYRGNGTVCTDACQNFCLNDGKCKKNSIGYVECVCKEQFSGERCEIRVKSRSSTIAFYIVAVAAGILIFIVIFIVIWMIYARGQRDDFAMNETEKPSLGMEGALTTNFLYARGPVERPPSSLTGGTHGPIHHPIGFYYEDDDEYETKTMFVGGAELQTQDQETEEQSELQREIQERFRHAQQHMYRPSGNSTKDD